MGSLEKNTISMTFFITLLVAYGTAGGLGINVQASINGLFAPWPNLGTTALRQCQNTDAGCIANNLALSTEHIAAAVTYPAILFFNILGRINAFFSAITGVFFGPEVGVQTVPFLDIIFLGIIVLPVTYELFRMARGNASAGTL